MVKKLKITLNLSNYSVGTNHKIHQTIIPPPVPPPKKKPVRFWEDRDFFFRFDQEIANHVLLETLLNIYIKITVKLVYVIVICMFDIENEILFDRT